MRVITGSARGRRLKELEGLETRPTTGKVKEALFSVIQFDIEGRRVLDLFAGTGQLGIEALSRGAKQCVFIDQRNDAVKLIRENLQVCGLTDSAVVRSGDAMAYLKSGEKFDLIFLDPPYASGLLVKALEDIAAFDICREHGIIVAESAVETDAGAGGLDTAARPTDGEKLIENLYYEIETLQFDDSVEQIQSLYSSGTYRLMSYSHALKSLISYLHGVFLPRQSSLLPLL